MSKTYNYTRAMYTEEDCKNALKKAKEKLGKSPKKKEYRKLDISPSVETIRNICGSWNKAKDEIGLKKYDRTKVIPCPKFLDIPEEKWKNMPATARHRIRNRKRIIRIKTEVGCQNCGYNSHPNAIDFHHKDKEDKEFSIRETSHRKYSDEKIEKEIKKCKILCANCHRVEESKYI